MVFESIVADLLNRFLGDFVDNLDSSQLNIGIWGGDVKLENLEIKESALDDFDLPVKLKYGYLSSLVLKIPWKNLYNEPVIATIDGLNIIAVPNKGVVYNEEKAKKNLADIKQKTLARLEEARKNRRKPVDPQADTFAEKMITQIIKNLQVSISNIHVRYEDKYTNRHRPFVAGVTLQKLDFQTTDENWIPTIHKEVVKIIHKLVLLDNLAIYWNSGSKLISDLTDKAEIKRKLQESIHSGKNKPIGYKYILEPIKMAAKLKLNQKPETDGTDWKTPKIDLEVDMQAIALAIGKLQYQDVLLFLEAQERFGLAGQYLKYRPNLNEYKGKYKDWWQFAYKSILEEKVRRRRNNWSWKRMKAHRDLVRKYRDAWVVRQTEKSPAAAVTQIIKEAEEKLDVFNVNVARQQAEMEIDRKGMTRLEDQPQGWVNWGKSWFGGGGSGASAQSKEKKAGNKDIASQFQEAMSPEEKAKLFEAIDYQENIPPTNYPKAFIENRFDFRLNQVAIVVDGAIAMQLLHLKAHVEQRPSAGAMSVQSSVQELRMDGCGAEMLRVRDPSRMWLSFILDTKPLSGEYDQKVQLSIAPVSLKYHAPAVNNAIDVFKPPESVKLNQLTALAMSRYEEVKARSMTGLAHAVENKSKLVLDINIEPATLMISHGGIYMPEKPTILADLGLLSVKTIDSTPSKSGMDKMSMLQEQAYDKFHVKLSNVVVTLAENFEKAKASLSVHDSPLHILKPTGLDIEIHKSSIDDLKLPKMKIIGNLPDIIVGLSDKRLLMLLRLLNSIPKPEAEPELIIEELPPLEPEGKLKDRAKMKTIMEVEEIDEERLEKANKEGEETEKKSKTSEQQVQIELDLHLNKIGFVLSKDDEVLCDVAILRMSCKLQMRTFDLVVLAELGAVRVGLPQFSSLDPNRSSCYLVDNDEQHGSLMKLKFVQANPESPFFATEYKNTEQIVEFTFSKLNVSLHQQGLMELKRFGEDLQLKMAQIEKETDAEKKAQVAEEETTGRKLSRAFSSSLESLAKMTKSAQSEAAAEKRKARKERAMAEADHSIIKMRVEMQVGSLAVLIGTQLDGCQTKMAIQNIKADVKMTLKEMNVIASLQAITMEDCTKGALYRKLMAVTGDKEMLLFEMTQYQRTEAEKKSMGPTDVDMRVKVRMAQMRFVFLNLWLSRLMGWLTPFQEEAVKAADAAKQAAAERAAEAAQNVKQLMEQSPPRIQLDVQLHAPVLIVPRLSTSNEVVVAILGNIIVNNQIIGHRDYPKAVLDKMDVKLTDMTFTIGKFDEKASRIETTCEILKPLTFAIDVQRNLTFGSVKQVAEITVDAHIPSIEMSMSEQDYATLMQTLNGNLNEGKDDEEKPVTEDLQKATETSARLSEESSDSDTEQPIARDRKISGMVTSKPSMSSPKKETTKRPTSFDRVLFQFKLDKIVAVLYTGGSSEERKESDAFAGMRLLHLNLAGSIKEDNAMNVKMALGSFTMNDERKGKTKIQQLMDKKQGHEKDQFLDLTFDQTAKQDKNVKIKMSAFYICLCPEFLGCLSRFFAVPQTEEEHDQQMIKRAGAASASTNVQFSREADATAPPPQEPGTITMDCDMKGVEVILVENSMQPETSQALILSFNVKIDAQPSASIQKMKGGVEKLAVYSSYYATARRSEVTYEVLKPMDIGVEMTVNTKTKSTDVVLKMSPMEVKMAPSIIRMLSSVNAEFAKSSAVDTTTNTTLPKLKTYPDYWKNKVLNKDKYWFFKAADTEEAEEAQEAGSVNGDMEIEGAPIEKATVLMERISFTLEAGTGTVPVPLIYLDMLINAEASGWSSALGASADLSMQMSYYNEEFSVWEPVIEPIEVGPEQFERWNVKTTVKGRNKLNPLDTSPGMDVHITAEKMLNVTVTKSFLNLLNKLSEVFAQAAKQISPPTTRHLPGVSPFLLLNETGMIVKALNTETVKISPSDAPVDAPHGDFLDLSLRKDAPKERSDSRITMSGEEFTGIVRLEIEDAVREIRVGRAEQRSIPLPKRSDAGKQWKMIAATTLENGRRLVTLTSHVAVHNHLDVPMELYSKRDTALDLFGTVPPGTAYNLPMPPLYSATGEIFFRPANDLCEVSFEPITWHDFEDEPAKRQVIRCDLSASSSQGYFFETVVTSEQVDEGLHEKAMTHIIHLYHPLEFHNILPVPITIEQPIAMDLNPGDNVTLNVIPGSRLKLWTSYLGEMYCLDMKVPEEKKEVDVVALNTETGSAELLLGINWSHEHGDQKAYLYAPFWLVNNTSMTLRHMECGSGFLASTAKGCVPCGKKVASHEETDMALKHLPDENPLILPFPTTDLTKKKKARVQVEGQSGWSDEFPLDTVGNSARIICKGEDRDYELTVDIKLCQSGLTKIVTFCPFYLVSNLSKFDMEVKEDGIENWVTVPAEKCIGVWPHSRSKKKLICARYSGTTEESLLFPIVENFETLCEVDGDYVGINVTVSTGESSVAIHLSSFQPGMCPACVINTLKVPVSFAQKGSSASTVGPNELAYFTWSNIIEDRVMELTCGDWKGEDKLETNRFADLKPDSSKKRCVYLVSFLVGRQRTLLFTDDVDIGMCAYGSWETDKLDLQAEISLQGFGLSVVDNLAGREILYIGISSSDILWEEEVKKGRFKPFAVKYMEQLEEKYQHHLITPNPDFQPLDQYQVNMRTMIMKKKKSKEVKLRRIFEQGIWMHYGKSAQRTRLHFKLNHLQIDNQLDACVFPRVLAVVPPPKSVIADNAPKPFIELSLLQRQSEYSSVPEIEYARALIQEFSVQVDQGLINALMSLVANQVDRKPYGKEMFDADLAMSCVRLEDTAEAYKTQRPKSFYNDLHISPLMIHLSFSQGGVSGDSAGMMPIQSEFINLFIKSVGVSLTELQDVVFKLAYFERRCMFYSPDQLNGEIVNHYTKQFLKQLYVLVLGLDIIGNPFGLVRDLSAGVEDLFYQPFQGAIQGPEELVQGLTLGVSSLFGHTVGGAAGAVGRITGTVGKGVAALTFDDEYQRKRQEEMNRRPQTFSEGMARGVKGLGMGVYSGITGVVTKPMEGARQDGARGLFKGVGKGLIGVVTRPVSGVVDFASSTMGAVRTVAGSHRDAEALRPPRVIKADKLIRPYSASEALGFRIFKETDRGSLFENDEYITFAPITDKIVLLVTKKQLVLGKRTDVMGVWAIDWQTEYIKMQEPQVIDGGIKILLKEKKRGFLGFGASDGKIFTFENAELIQQKIIQAYRAAAL